VTHSRTISVSTTHTHTHPFNGPLPGTTRVSQYQKGKTNLDFTEARDSEWQWHQLGQMQVCTSLQTDNHTSTPLLSFLQAGCPSCRPTSSVKTLKIYMTTHTNLLYIKRKKTEDRRAGIRCIKYKSHNIPISMKIRLMKALVWLCSNIRL